MSKKGKKKSFDEDQFDAFLKESLSSDESFSTPKKKKDSIPWWMEESISETADHKGKSNKFMKTANATLETTDGLDTLDELAEKDRFFDELEGNASQTVDYSKLNKALEDSSTLEGGRGKGIAEAKEQDDLLARIEKCLEKKPSPPPRSPSRSSSAYSEQYEEEQSGEERESPDVGETSSQTSQEEEEEDEKALVKDRDVPVKANLLANVSLLDSRDNTLGTMHAKTQHIAVDNSDYEENNDNKSPIKRGLLSPGRPQPATRFTHTSGISDMPVTTTTNDELEALQSALRNVADNLTSTEELHAPIPAEIPNSKNDKFNRPPPEDAEKDLGQLFSDLSQLDVDVKPSKPRPEPRSRSKGSRYSHVTSSGYGKPPQSRTSKIPVPWSPKHSFEYKTKGTMQKEVQKPLKQKESSRETQLLASVESFAHYVKEHFVGDNEVSERKQSPRSETVSLNEEVQALYEQLRDERKRVTKLAAELAAQERAFKLEIGELKQDYDQEVFRLKQDNFVLSAKVASVDSQANLMQQIKDGKVDGIGKEQMDLMEKEIREQEKLLAGYEQENKKLYQEVKKMQNANKDTEERLFKENQKLTTEIISLRQEIETKDVRMKTHGHQSRTLADIQLSRGGVGTAVLGAGRITELNAQLKETQNKIMKLERDLVVAEQSNKELEEHIERLVRDRERLNDDISNKKGHDSQHVQEMLQTYEQEINKLKNRIKWFTENQVLLDRDSDVIKSKNEEIRNLQEKLGKAEKKAGEYNQEQRVRADERTSDAKRIQDLQRQVKEMEMIMKKRNPNSIPALIWAASSAPDIQPLAKPPTTKFLENRVQKLEMDLQDKDEETKRSLRVMEQKYTVIKMQYEERINELERSSLHPHTHNVALERELQTVKDVNRKKVSQLEEVNNQLKDEVRQYKAKENATEYRVKERSSNLEIDLRKQIERLNQQLLQAEDQIHVLRKENDILTKDRKLLEENKKELSHVSSRDSKASKSRLKDKGKTKMITPREEPILKPYEDNFAVNKQYEPQSFSGTHVSDLTRENEQLRARIGDMELAIDRQRIDYQRSMAKSESLLRQTQENMHDEMDALKSAHKREVERLLADHAMKFSVSKLSELQSKVDTQEVMIKHLKENGHQVDVVEERLAASKIKEMALENHIKLVQEDLREARKSHTPEMRHFESLFDRIKELESKNAHHDQKLHTMITHRQYSIEAEEEIARWKKLVAVKNDENERFRSELDAILQMLRELQRQGVTIPIGRTSTLI